MCAVLIGSRVSLTIYHLVPVSALTDEPDSAEDPQHNNQDRGLPSRQAVSLTGDTDPAASEASTEDGDLDLEHAGDAHTRVPGVPEKSRFEQTMEDLRLTSRLPNAKLHGGTQQSAPGTEDITMRLDLENMVRRRFLNRDPG